MILKGTPAIASLRRPCKNNKLKFSSDRYRTKILKLSFQAFVKGGLNYLNHKNKKTAGEKISGGLPA